MAEPSPKPAQTFDRSIVDGPLGPAVWRLAWPTMLQNVVAGLQGIIDHIMVGTDYPYDLGDWSSAKKVAQLDISEADKLLMLEGNAKRLLKIK